MSEAITTPSTSQRLSDEKMEESDSPRKILKKRGRKKGSKIEMISLALGGCGGKRRVDDDRDNDHPWKLEAGTTSNYNKDSSSEDDSSYADSSVDISGDDFEYDEFEEECITNMKGNRILPIDRIGAVIRNTMCCKKMCIGRE